MVEHDTCIRTAAATKTTASATQICIHTNREIETERYSKECSGGCGSRTGNDWHDFANDIKQRIQHILRDGSGRKAGRVEANKNGSAEEVGCGKYDDHGQNLLQEKTNTTDVRLESGAAVIKHGNSNPEADR